MKRLTQRSTGGMAGMVLLAALLATGCTNSIRVQEDFSRQVDWAGYDTVIVRTSNGAIDVAPDAGASSVLIKGVKFATGSSEEDARAALGKLEVTAAAQADNPRTLLVELRVPAELVGRSVGASINVRVPQAVAADLTTNNGGVHARGLRRAVKAVTTNGRIDVQDVAGDVSATSTNGTVAARGVQGRCALQTTNGDVELDARDGDVSAVTTNGSIRATAAPPAEGQVSLRTTNGSIHAAVPPNLKGQLDMSCTNGRVTTEIKDMSFTNPRTDRRSFEATMNGGGAGKVTARTTNGSVTLTSCTVK